MCTKHRGGGFRRGNSPEGSSHVDLYKVFGPSVSPSVCDGPASWQTLAFIVCVWGRDLDVTVNFSAALWLAQPATARQEEKEGRDKMVVNSNIKGFCNELNTLN